MFGLIELYNKQEHLFYFYDKVIEKYVNNAILTAG